MRIRDLQEEDPAMRWQMSLYKEMSGKAEDAEDPEKVVKRVQEVSAVLYHIELVSTNNTNIAADAFWQLWRFTRSSPMVLIGVSSFCCVFCK